MKTYGKTNGEQCVPPLTIGETTEQLRLALRDYIEATYHISHDKLVLQRQRLLDTVAVIHQQPYLESTPKYQLGPRFDEIEGLDPVVRDVFASVSSEIGGKRHVYDPPYQHQSDAVRLSLVEGKSLV